MPAPPPSRHKKVSPHVLQMLEKMWANEETRGAVSKHEIEVVPAISHATNHAHDAAEDALKAAAVSHMDNDQRESTLRDIRRVAAALHFVIDRFDVCNVDVNPPSCRATLARHKQVTEELEVAESRLMRARAENTQATEPAATSTPGSGDGEGGENATRKKKRKKKKKKKVQQAVATPPAKETSESFIRKFAGSKTSEPTLTPGAATPALAATLPPACPLCFDEYDATNCKPRILSCGHTFCGSCLDTMLRRIVAEGAGKSLDCPKCRRMCVVQRGQATSLPVNYDILTDF
jgi:hypothetical protein